MDSGSEGVAAAKRAAAESEPRFPHSYDLTPHPRRKSGTCMTALRPETSSFREKGVGVRGWVGVWRFCLFF